MIYFISNQQRTQYIGDVKFEVKEGKNDYIKTSTIEECLEYFKDTEEIGVDTETTGFDPYRDRILSLQLGDFNNQFVIDSSIDFTIFKELLETRVILGQNLKFDLRFLYKLGIHPKKLYDTFLAECVLTTGFTERGLGLKDLGLKYCNVELDKSIRGVIHKEGLTDRVIKYGADDVKYLSTIKEKQLLEINKWGLQNILDLENEVLKVFSLMEYNGIPFNPTKWIEVSEQVEKNTKELEDKLDTLIYQLGTKDLPNINSITKYCNIWKQGSLFFDIKERDCNINWASPAQKLKLLRDLGFKLESVGDKDLQRNKSKHPIFNLLIEYSKQNKLATSFGKDFLKFINPVTKRLHPNYWQILSTGRISVSEPNINQIPAHGELATKIRSAFEAPEGYKIVGGDYSGFELRIIAEFSQDPLWLQAFREGGDLHSILCSKTFDIPIEDVKKSFPGKPEFKYRDVQKTINFGLAYGMSEFKLADTMQISVEEAKGIIAKFFSVVPKVKQFLDMLGYSGRTRGYIRTPEPLRRIRWYQNWEKAYKESDSKVLGEIERASKNMPIQSTNANVIKLAMIRVQKIIDENNYPVQIIMQVYDELQCLCKEEFAEEWRIILEKIMIESAEEIIKSIPIVADCKISDYWSK